MTMCFRPMPDITSYEVAYILGRVGGVGIPWQGVSFTEKQWAEDVPEEMKRHFQEPV